MVNTVPTTPTVSRTSYLGYPQSIQNFNEGAMETIPIAGKLGDNKTKAKSSLAIMAGGAAIGPVLGVGLNKVTNPGGPFMKLAETISNKTTGFDKWFSGLKIGEKFGKLWNPVKSKLFKGPNLKTFNKGFGESILIRGAKETLKTASETLDGAKAAKALADASKDTKVIQKAADALAKATSKHGAAKLALENATKNLAHVNKLGVLGRSFGKTGMFLKRHLTGTMGIFNGLFAAMTVNSVIQAKKGEKFSTLMEDVLGTWVGSLGGFSLFGGLLKRLMNFVDPVTKTVTAKGVLPTIAKIVNKIPGKTFVIPLIGAMVLSSVLQKFSHKVFGKPTKEEDVKKAQAQLQGNPQEPAKPGTMNGWLNKTGWTAQDFAAVKAAQGNLNPPANNNQNTPANNLPAEQKNNGYKGYMPKAEVPETVLKANDLAVTRLTSQVDTALADMATDMKRYGIQI